MASSAPNQPTPATYREVVRQPIWLFAVVWVLSLLLAFTFAAVVGPVGAGVLLVVLGGVVTYILLRGSLRITVTDSGLVAGDLRIRASSIASAEGLTAEQTRRVIGPDADVTARLALRNLSCKTAVRIDLDRSRSSDSTVPYVVLSSRHPEQLAAALQSIREPQGSAPPEPPER